MEQIIEKFNDGNLKYKYYVNKRGDIHGLLIRYYDDGKNIWYKTNWNNGDQYGLKTFWYKSGKIEKQKYYL